ncbi:hypothetical protein K493DRAFT_316268 [Basidiobolus meristosporus CBS 931.73]|uniref:Pectin lyase-like protein n=1 Tax=Basidiobolus meristosporus CBS 931.73 TaxID=1314790 RepID=A0A1Y1Y5W5_9FUNG|nr:hypothetical protein K493DRAFT_316268 [Basidiobolus meristosporus CBS 931.73]|eukprot:ORX92974.1 hypothetical protein K493DRAFT_316268 [Basidiobolus meristosporus CBS 931.73]
MVMNFDTKKPPQSRRKYYIIGGVVLLILVVVGIVLGVVLTRKSSDGVMPTICITGLNETISLVPNATSTTLSELEPSRRSGISNLVSANANTTGLCYSVLNNLYDVIPDFSGTGYRAGLAEIPSDIPVVHTISPNSGGGDDTRRIQEAINTVASKSVDKNGFRGALLLTSGIYRLADTITLSSSGIVLRGDPNGNTTLIGTSPRTYTLIRANGPSGGLSGSTKYNIAQTYVPLGAFQFTIKSGDSRNFKVGDDVIVARKGNQDWIKEINMADLSKRDPPGRHSTNWTPFELTFTRKVTAVDYRSGMIAIDVPLTNSIDSRWGGGYIQKYSLNRLENIGVEYINAISTFDPSKKSTVGRSTEYLNDENHADKVVIFEGVMNGWIKHVTAKYFNHFIELGRNSKWVTVDSCSYSEPVSTITGGARYPYLINSGAEQILVRHSTSSESRHAFSYGSRVSGPNVFYNCTAEREYSTSEPHMHWSTGGLYDNVKSNIAVQNREYYGSGHGWSGANYVLWNTQGDNTVQKPPTAWNFAVGTTGRQNKGAFANQAEQGWWESFQKPVLPRSLYLKQLEDRINTYKMKNSS